MKKYYAFAAAALALSACQEKDVYDSSFQNKVYAQSWEQEFGAIDPNQTWSNFRDNTVSVSVNEYAGESYKVNVFTSNPFRENSNAQLLATCDMQGGSTVNLNTCSPAAVACLFVTRTDKAGRVSVCMCPSRTASL